MRVRSGRLCAAAAMLALGVTARAATTVVVVEGLPGNAQFADEFAAQTTGIETAVRTLRPQPELRVFRGAEATREALLAWLGALAERRDRPDPLFVYLVGHGSFDEHEYKFNLPGPDVTDADLKGALDALGEGRVVLVNTSSASGAAHEQWQHEARIVVTATRSGVERHATRFGGYFVSALSAPGADTDKNNRVTVQEAFDFASRAVTEYFDSEGRLATEHARISGAGADRVALARLDVARDPGTADPALTRLVEERDSLSGRVDALRMARDELTPEQYQEELLELMLRLAEVEERIEQAERDGAPR